MNESSDNPLCIFHFNEWYLGDYDCRTMQFMLDKVKRNKLYDSAELIEYYEYYLKKFNKIEDAQGIYVMLGVRKNKLKEIPPDHNPHSFYTEMP